MVDLSILKIKKMNQAETNLLILSLYAQLAHDLSALLMEAKPKLSAPLRSRIDTLRLASSGLLRVIQDAGFDPTDEANIELIGRIDDELRKELSKLNS